MVAPALRQSRWSPLWQFCVDRIGAAALIGVWRSLAETFRWGQLRAKVDGHLYGRFLRASVRHGCSPTHVPIGLAAVPQLSFSQIGSRRFPAHLCGFLNAPQRPSQPPQRDDLLFRLLVQDVAHIDAG